MHTSTLFFTIAGMDTTRMTMQSDRSNDFFLGHKPMCLVCPTPVLAEYVYSRFVEPGQVTVHANLDGTPGNLSVAVFLQIQYHAPLVLLPSDYEMLGAISGSVIPPLRADTQRVIFGNGHDVLDDEYLGLWAELQAKGTLAVVIGGITAPPYYALPSNANLLRAKHCTHVSHQDFMRRIRGLVR